MSLKKSFIKSRNSFKVTFKVPEQVNPEGKEIRILGGFNNWSWEEAPALKPTNGTFKVDVELKAGSTYEYRFMVDQSYWLNDGLADAYTPSPYDNVENCVVVLDLPETASSVAAPSVAAPKKVAKKASKKTTPVAKSKTEVKVDFTKIEGIGPKIASLILEAGYITYEDLAKAKKKELTAILSAAGKRFQMHDPSSWAKQSKFLAQGNLVALKKLQDELKGGRKA